MVTVTFEASRPEPKAIEKWPLSLAAQAQVKNPCLVRLRLFACAEGEDDGGSAQVVQVLLSGKSLV